MGRCSDQAPVSVPNSTSFAAIFMMCYRRAAREAGASRFAASEFELGPDADGEVDLMEMKNLVRREVQRYAAMGMECTHFCTSILMNYLATSFDFPGDDAHAEEMLEGFDDTLITWNIAAGTAEIPVKENKKITRGYLHLPPAHWPIRRRGVHYAGDKVAAYHAHD